MRIRILNGRLAGLCVACLLMTGILTGCGGGNSTYNPTLIGGQTTPGSFTMAVTPTTNGGNPGASFTYTATLTAVNGFSTPVTLSASNLPAGVTATFSPTTVTPTSTGAADTVTIATTGAPAPGSLTGTIQSVGAPTRAETPTGNYAITITATGGGLTQQATVTLNLYAP